MTAPIADGLNNLEQSFAALFTRHRLTNFGVAYHGDRHGGAYRFHATAHFDDAAEGQIPCATGDGYNIETAIRAMLGELDAKRRLPLVGEEALYGDDPLVAEAA